MLSWLVEIIGSECVEFFLGILVGGCCVVSEVFLCGVVFFYDV